MLPIIGSIPVNERFSELVSSRVLVSTIVGAVHRCHQLGRIISTVNSAGGNHQEDVVQERPPIIASNEKPEFINRSNHFWMFRIRSGLNFLRFAP